MSSLIVCPLAFVTGECRKPTAIRRGYPMNLRSRREDYHNCAFFIMAVRKKQKKMMGLCFRRDRRFFEVCLDSKFTFAGILELIDRDFRDGILDLF